MSSKDDIPLSILGHLDTFYGLEYQGRSFIKPSDKGHCDYDRMMRAKAQFALFAVFPAKSQYNIIQGLDRWFRYLDEYQSHMVHVKNIADFDTIKQTNKIGAILHTEGTGGYDSEFQLLRLAARLGLRSIGITHANPNRYATGYLFYGEQIPRGLSKEGEELIHEAQRLGITVDVSHLNDVSFWDVMKVTEKPLLATHSNARSICDMGRNLTDDQILAMRDNHGVIGLNFGTMFLDPGKDQNRSDLPISIVKDHLDHLVNLAGIDSIALGTDYDGTGIPTCINSCEKLVDLYQYLLTNGYSSSDLKKMAFENFHRVFKATWV